MNEAYQPNDSDKPTVGQGLFLLAVISLNDTGMFNPDPRPPVGAVVDIRYLPDWPTQSVYPEVYQSNSIFWVFFVWACLLAWFWLLLIGKIIALAKEG